MTNLRSNAAILFANDCYGTRGERLMGRQAAGEGFLNGYLSHSGVDRFFCHCAERSEANNFLELASPLLNGRTVTWIAKPQIAAIAEPGTLYVPGPELGAYAWQRHRLSDQRAFSLCGVTHTTASETAMKLIIELITAPVQSWDALICTSLAVKANVERLFQGQREYLAVRTGATRFTLPQLPVIPLGVDTSKFVSDPAARHRWRSELQLADENLVVIFVGRLSFHAKAHHVPMYMALESAARQTKKQVTFVMAGWFANESIEKIFREDAARYCPSVRVVFLDGRKPEIRYPIWQAADVFLSLSDNLQESFGLTPVEAMAAGLPAVVSDWDGYRDTIRDGIDGFRVPCASPAPGFGGDQAARFELDLDNYDHYCSGTSQFVAVDINAAATALADLFTNSGLRLQMGSAGRLRAKQTYDWSTIVGQYQTLWQQLSEIRNSADESVPRNNPASTNPNFRDPWWLFEGYATLAIQPDDLVQATSSATPESLEGLWTGQGTCPGTLQNLLPTLEELKQLIERARTERSLRDLVSGFSPIRQPLIMRSTLWLMKYGMMTVARRK